MSGTLALTNTFADPPVGGKRPGADLDQNFSDVATYVNIREISFGLLANRPAFGVPGRFYFATDTQGGTLYADDGTQWNQLGPGVTIQAPQNTVIILASYKLASL